MKLGAILIAFALWATAHIAIAHGLVLRTPRWRAPIALLLLPLAPYWALRSRMLVRGVLWLGAAIVYGVAFLLWRR